MEWKLEYHDLVHFLKSNENHFRVFLKFADENSDPYVKNKMAVATIDANNAFEKYIADLGFGSREDIDAKSKEEVRSLLVRIEHLHGAANTAKKNRDFVSGLDLGELQERIVEIFLNCLDQDWNYFIDRLKEIAKFETLLKAVLRDSTSVSWLKWQLDLTGSSVEEAQVPDIRYENGVSTVNVNPEYDIMLSVSHIALGLIDHQQCMTEANFPGYVYLSTPSLSNNSADLLKLMTMKDSKYYLSALKFREEMYRIFYDLKLFSDAVTKGPEMEDFEMKVAPHGPAVQIDETYEDEEDPFLSYDLVPAIKFSGWPKCSQQWVERKRAWPPQALVEEIVQEGFHLVPKTSLQGDEELEWRMSFSKAEVKLMKAKGLGNRNYCYRIFKMAIKENISSTCNLLTTYHLKTLLLWASERYPPDWWSNENVAGCFLGLLDDLLHSLVNGACPHYFIPELNLFANCSTDHLFFLASKVSAIRKFPLKYLKRPGEDPKEGYENFIRAMKEWQETDYGEI